MKFLIFCLCSLSGFREAYGIFCLSCYQRGSEKCKEKEVFCPEDSKCITISELIYLDGMTFQSFYKGCAGNLSCDTSSYGSTEKAHFAQSYSCCSGNYCNTETFSMPPADSDEFNGIECPSCFQFGLEECISTKKRMCRGSENKCRQYIGRFRKPDGKEIEFSLKSCGSSLACERGVSSFLGIKEMFHTVFNCT
ncbi:phospholipase A2 inhibitor gamma subunit B-like [Discoglossus pictus]